MKLRRQAGALVMTACLLGMASGASADVFVPKVAGGNWNVTTTWTKAEGTSNRNYPYYNYDDTAAFTNNVGGDKYAVQIPSSGTSIGCARLVFYARPYYYTPVDVVTPYNTSGTMVFQSSDGLAIIHAQRGSDLSLGYRYSSTGILTMQLRSNLLITNDTVGDITLTVGTVQGNYADARFTDNGTPRDITVNASASKLLNVRLFSSISTFRGNWYVIGEKATLTAYAQGSLGDPSNRVVLREGGRVSFSAIVDKKPVAMPARTWTRRLEGTGSVLSTEFFTNGVSGVISPGENGVGTLNITAGTNTLSSAGVVEVDLVDDNTFDVVNFTGDLELGGALAVTTLGDYAPVARQKWPVMTATGTITGAFDDVTEGFDVSVEAGNVMLRRTPPLGTTVIIH